MRLIFLGIMVSILSNATWLMAMPFRGRPADAGFPGEWLTAFSASARDAGLANASTALTGSAAAYANPAGIAGSRMGEASFMVAPLFSAGQFQTLCVVYPLTLHQNLGLTFIHLGSGKAERTDDFGQSLGSFDEQNLAFLLSYGQRFLEKLDLGLNLKVVRQSIAEFSATGFGLDMGLQARPFGDALTLGLSLQNILPPKLKLKQEKDKFPLFARGGVAYRFETSGRLYLVSADVVLLDFAGAYQAVRWGGAVEGQPIAYLPFFIRLGVNQREYALGFGIMAGALRFDYAAAFHELEILHRFGITVRFGIRPPFAEKKLKAQEKKLKAEWKRIHEKKAELNRMKNEIQEEKDRLTKGVKLIHLRQEAQKQLEKGNYKKSQKLVERILEINPKDHGALSIMENTQDYRARQTALAQFARARKHYAAKQYRESSQALENALPYLQDYPEALILATMAQSHIYLKNGEYKSAQKQLLKAVEMEPSHREAILLYEKVKDVLEAHEAR